MHRASEPPLAPYPQHYLAPTRRTVFAMILALTVVFFVMLAVMTAAWATVRTTQNGGWIDVFWTFGTGAAGVIAALSPWAGPPGARQLLVAVLVALWSLRLGSYIALRVASGAEDVRYRRLKTEWGERFMPRLFGLAIVQAPASTLLCASIAAAALRPGADLTAGDFAGAAMLLIAIAGESLADAQMKRFKADEENHGKVMDRGLWGWSRHPNYFFEWLAWLSYPVIAIDLRGNWPAGWTALLGPAAMYVVLTRLTGVPPLESAMVASKGDAYRAYQSRVSSFFPAPPRSAPRSPA